MAESEFRRSWTVVLTAAIGVGLGIAGLLTYTAGVFAKDLGSAIGLTRTTLGMAFFMSTIALAIGLQGVGWVIDRIGPRWPAAFGSFALSIGFLLLGTSVHSVGGYMLVMTMMGLFAAGSAPVAYTRAVNAVFDRSRGLALGFTQLGIGLSAMLVPPALADVIAYHGWQHGYLVLAAVALMGIVPALSLPRAITTVSVSNAPVTDIIGSATYLRMLAAFGLMALSFAGLLTHFIPLLREAGLNPRGAGMAAGLIGASVIVSRIVVGWLADRIEAPLIAAVSCGLCALGCLALAWGGAAAAWVGAIALGAAMGAEADLIGFLTARYFGISNYGRLYALQYASFMVAAGVSPLWIGILADRTGGYTLPLVVAAAGLCGAILLFLHLPKTR